MALTDHVHHVGWIIGTMDNKIEGLKKEIVDLRAGLGPEAIAAAKQRAAMEKLKVELPTKAIVEYKRSTSFKMGLVRTG
ncbi:hypothetical protein BHM03_00046530 [Ensete ventricosum]|nr:hypothetical protein BHM03_00046530 [Ensete ventricosum]